VKISKKVFFLGGGYFSWLTL